MEGAQVAEQRPNWFPLYRAMMENPDFTDLLSPVEKLFMLLLISEYNMRGAFRKCDLEIAATLGVSESKVRQARYKLAELGWIATVPGFKLPGKKTGIATLYDAVKWAVVTENGDFFARMHRFAFEQLLSKVRSGTFTHADVVTYVYLCYLNERNGSKGEFYVTKQELRELTNIENVAACVARLHDRFQFTSGAPLFEYQDLYHKLLVRKFRCFADPSKDENNARIAAVMKDEVRQRINRMRAEKEAAAKRRKKCGDRRKQARAAG